MQCNFSLTCDEAVIGLCFYHQKLAHVFIDYDSSAVCSTVCTYVGPDHPESCSPCAISELVVSEPVAPAVKSSTLTVADDVADNTKHMLHRVRLSPSNVHNYIGHTCEFYSRGVLCTSKIFSASASGRTIRIDNVDIGCFLEIVTRRVYVVW
jgi:hypothetical protein